MRIFLIQFPNTFCYLGSVGQCRQWMMHFLVIWDHCDIFLELSSFFFNPVVAVQTSTFSRSLRMHEFSPFPSFSYRMGLSLVKTTSLASPIQRVPLKSTQQQSRKTAEHSVASVFRRGYDGLGGHTKFLAPSRPTKKAVRKVAKPIGVSKFIKHSSFACAEPPLPVMDLDAT